MKPHAAGAVIAVLVLVAGARAYADPASTPAPAPSVQLVSVQTSAPNVQNTPNAPSANDGALVAEARAAKAMAGQAMATLETTSANVRALLRRARARGTRDEIACVDEGLSRADVAMRRAREEAAAAQEAYAHGNVTEARKANDRVLRARDAARIAASTAAACFEPPARSSGTQVRVVMDAPAAPST